MRYLILFLILMWARLLWAQPNLALTATPSASASSAGNFGPSNWTDGLKNAVNFGWLGTALNFPQPAWMELQWSQAQVFNQIRLFNPGTNFMPPAGNAVVLSGSFVLQFWDGLAWVNHDTLFGQGSYGDSINYDFPTITTTRIRLTHFNITGDANPGFDEWEVYHIPSDTLDAALVDYLVENVFGGTGLAMRINLRIRNAGNRPLVNPTLGWIVNTFPETGPFNVVISMSLAPGEDTLVLHPETTPAIQSLNGRELCMWVSLAGDGNAANDTLCVPLAGFGSAVAPLDGSDGPMLYPNPSSGILQLKHAPQEAEFTITDLQGKVNVRGIWAENGLVLPAFMADGTYFLMLETPQKRYGTLFVLRR